MKLPRLPYPLVLLTLLVWLLHGCAFKPYPQQLPSSSAQNWLRGFGQYRIEMTMDPARPKAGQDVAIAFVLNDESREPPVPVRGAYLSCYARMPNIPNYTIYREGRTDVLNRSPGVYPLRLFQFPVGGRWNIIVHAQLLDDTTFLSVYPIDVAGPPWPPDFVPELPKQTRLPFHPR